MIEGTILITYILIEVVNCTTFFTMLII